MPNLSKRLKGRRVSKNIEDRRSERLSEEDRKIVALGLKLDKTILSNGTVNNLRKHVRGGKVTREDILAGKRLDQSEADQMQRDSRRRHTKEENDKVDADFAAGRAKFRPSKEAQRTKFLEPSAYKPGDYAKSRKKK